MNKQVPERVAIWNEQEPKYRFWHSCKNVETGKKESWKCAGKK